MCSVDNKNNLSSSNTGNIAVEDNSFDMESAIGISLDGVLLYPALEINSTGEYVDPFFNTDYNDPSKDDEVVMDGCYGTVNEDGTYFFRTATNCVLDDTVTEGYSITRSDIKGKMDN